MKDFELALAAQKAHFAESVEGIGYGTADKSVTPLFRTDCGEKLVKLYKALMAEQGDDVLAHYDCTACKNFLRHYGGAVRITEDGELESVFWPAPESELTKGIGKVWRDIFAKLRALVQSSKVTWPLVPLTSGLGVESCSGWNHWYGKLDNYPTTMAHTRSTLYDVFTKEKEALTRNRGYYYTKLPNLDKTVVEAARDWLTLNPQSRRKHLDKMQWHVELQNRLRKAKKGNRANIVLLLAGEKMLGAGKAYGLAAAVEGMLCDGIKEGKSPAHLKGLFGQATHRDNFNVPKAPPKEQTIDQAEKLFSEMDLGTALDRKYVPHDEIAQHAIWNAPAKKEADSKGGLFADLRDTPIEQDMESGEYTTCTLDNFLKDVLPKAQSVTLDNIRNYLRASPAAYFCGPVNPEAKPIVRWDDRSDGGTPNPYNWGFTNEVSSGYLDVADSELVAMMPLCDSWNGREGNFADILFVFAAKAREALRNHTCLFPEILRSELYPVRSVMHTHSTKSQMQGDLTHAGVSLQKGSTHYPLKVSVKTDAGIAKYSVVNI